MKRYGAVITLILLILLSICAGIGVAVAKIPEPAIMDLQCHFKSGWAEKTQQIRQETGDSIDQFISRTNKMYVHDEALTNMQELSRMVYEYIPVTTKPEVLRKAVYTACWAEWREVIKAEQNKQEFEL